MLKSVIPRDLGSVGHCPQFAPDLGLGRLREQAGYREEVRPEDGKSKTF